MSKKITKKQIMLLASERNHELLEIDFEEKYKDINSRVEFKCLTCKTTFETSVRSYKNAKKTGCPNCKKIMTSKTHKGKVIREETRALIGEKASQRAGSLKGQFGSNHPRYKGGYARDFQNPSSLDYVWKNAIKKLYKNTCVLTGVKTNLVCHHLESWNNCPERRYDISNGVLIAKIVHNQFHTEYHFGNNTETQFAEFCKKYYNVDWLILKENFWQSSAKLSSEEK